MATFLPDWLEGFHHIFSTGPSKDRLCDVFWSCGSRWLRSLLQPYGWTHQLCSFSIQQLCWHKRRPHVTLLWEGTARHESLAPVHSQIQTVRGKHDAKPPTRGATPQHWSSQFLRKWLRGQLALEPRRTSTVCFQQEVTEQSAADTMWWDEPVLSPSRTDQTFPFNEKCPSMSSKRTEIKFSWNLI